MRRASAAAWLLILGLALAVFPAGPVRADIDQDEQPERTPDQPQPEPEGPLRGEALPVLPPGVLAVTHGVACGDVTDHSAVIWARAEGDGQMHVALAKDPSFENAAVVLSAVPATADDDFTASMSLPNLEPSTDYYYRVWFTHDPQALPVPDLAMTQGRFRTAPDSTAANPVTFVWGGQLGGDDYCRGHSGYPVFDGMTALDPDFFVSLGDMIYADGVCTSEHHNRPGDFVSIDDASVVWSDPTTVRPALWAHYRYNRADEHLRGLLESTAWYATWDDREVRDDFGASWPSVATTIPPRPGFPALAAEGRGAFMHYAPIDRFSPDPARIYRAFRWGRNLDLFVLDTRSYRSPDDSSDTAPHAKTLLGDRQREWLLRGLIGSNAVFKAVVCPAPLSIPVGDGIHGRDGWANGSEADSTGFERELLGLLTALDRAGVKNVVFLTGNAGWAAEIRYARDFDGDGKPLVFYEIATPPLSAATASPVPLDKTLQPQLVYQEGGLLGFGSAAIRMKGDGSAHLVVDVRGSDGAPRPGSTLDIQAQ